MPWFFFAVRRYEVRQRISSFSYTPEHLKLQEEVTEGRKIVYRGGD